MKYNPKATYNWPADAQITLTGKEFETLYNNLKSFINSKGEISNILKVADAFGVLHSKFAQLVENDVIKEAFFNSDFSPNALQEMEKKVREAFYTNTGIVPLTEERTSEWSKDNLDFIKDPNKLVILDSNPKAFVGEKQ